MKKFLLSLILIFTGAIWTNFYAQVTPAGAGDKNLENRDVKGRSVELERVSRDADKENAKKTNESKFAEIKEDFENMQMANNNIQKSVGAAEINLKSINDWSAQINKSAVRLKSNLFPNAKSKKSKDKKDKNNAPENQSPAPELKTLTDTVNVAIFDFTHNPMFSDPKYTEADSTKAQTDLEKIIATSQTIEKQTEKTN